MLSLPETSSPKRDRELATVLKLWSGGAQGGNLEGEIGQILGFTRFYLL